MAKLKETVIFSPSIIALLIIRLTNSGVIYYADTGDKFVSFLLERLKSILGFMHIFPFSYRIGIGSFGNGHINSIYKTAGRLTEQLYVLKSDEKLVKMFNRRFNSNKLEHAWKRHSYAKVRNIVTTTFAIVYNYLSKSAVYVPCNSTEGFVLNKLCNDTEMQNLDVRYFHRPLINIFQFVLYFVIMIRRVALSGIELHSEVRPKKYRVMTEAVRYMDQEKSFNMLEWWDRDRVDKDDILIISRSSTEPGRIASFIEAKRRGFHCAEVSKRRKIPANRISDMIKTYFLFPLQIVLYLCRSGNISMFLSYLRESFRWTLFFCYYEANYIVLSTEGFEPTWVNRLGCSTIQYSLSYLGNFENPLYKYIGANHLLVWGEGQISQSKKYFSVDKLYYTGCHGLSYLNREKRTEIMSKLPNLDVTKKNVVFFDNKLFKNASNPEMVYFRFIELILKCTEIVDVNMFFRPKSLKPFDVPEIKDKKRSNDLRERCEKAHISIINDMKMDVMSVMSIADIVIYSTVGTVNMMALMVGIPALCYYDYIDQTPDQIMKHYLNELVFDNQELLIKRIKEILDGDHSAELRVEDKKRLNHYLDFNGLERLQATVADIIQCDER